MGPIASGESKPVAAAATFDPNERFLAVGAVATHFGVTQVTIKNWVDAGKLLAARTVGGHRRVAASSVVTLLEQLGRPVPPSLTRAMPMVVLVAGESSTTRALKRALSNRARVELIGDDYAALLLCARLRPEVIVFDLALPGLDPRRVITALARDPATRAAELLALGGAGDEVRITSGGARAPVEVVRRGDVPVLVAAIGSRLERAAKRRA